MKKFVCFWFVPLFIIGTVLLATACFGGISEAIDATCRVSGGPGTAMGTGIAIHVDGDDLYVLTNAHVVGKRRTAVCEFWVDGHQVRDLTGTVVHSDRNGNKDIAVIRISLNGQVAPHIIPIADIARLPVNSTIASVGVGGGVWPTAFIGHVKAYQNDGDTMIFVPSPANGRSGSAIMDEDCTAVVGLLYARNPKEKHGKAMSLQNIQEVLTQCGPDGCPIPNQLPKRNFNMLGRQQFTIPPSPPRVPQVQGMPGYDPAIYAELNYLRTEIERLGEIAQRAEDAGLLAGDALEVAEEAVEVAESVKDEVENGGLFARLRERVSSTAVGAVISKLGLPALGLGGGVIGIVVWLVRKDIKNLRENGDPLWISKIAERTKNTIDDRIAEKVTKVAETDLFSRLFERLSDRFGGDKKSGSDSITENLATEVSKAKELIGLLGDKNEPKLVV